MFIILNYSELWIYAAEACYQVFDITFSGINYFLLLRDLKGEPPQGTADGSRKCGITDFSRDEICTIHKFLNTFKQDYSIHLSCSIGHVSHL